MDTPKKVFFRPVTSLYINILGQVSFSHRLYSSVVGSWNIAVWSEIAHSKVEIRIDFAFKNLI